MNLSCARWRKSSYSADVTNCVEVADLDHVVAVRDSRDPTGPALTFSPAAWASFIITMKRRAQLF
jgi:Domain of unknown function (DUF397)